jgi:hypothetical protein
MRQGGILSMEKVCVCVCACVYVCGFTCIMRVTFAYICKDIRILCMCMMSVTHMHIHTYAHMQVLDQFGDVVLAYEMQTHTHTHYVCA